MLCILLLAGCSDDGILTQRQIRVSDVTLEQRPGGARILRGWVENRSNKELSIVQIQFSLYDGDNRRVDSMGIVVRSIPAGGQVSFREAIQSDHDVRGVRPRAVLIP
ncbi:MAG: FxLYD domain-containing protein [Bacteroidetes bacterium]|nr:FxLYD domain-containing protein [Bacteroidota bacterium]MDA0873729.1 FxLYD domain-containing protein [Bacteroidota bacterium]